MRRICLYNRTMDSIIYKLHSVVIIIAVTTKRCVPQLSLFFELPFLDLFHFYYILKLLILPHLIRHAWVHL